MRSVLVDVGPLIAPADRSDEHHRRVTAFLRRFNGRLLTTWPVLADWKETYLDLPVDVADASLIWVASSRSRRETAFASLGFVLGLMASWYPDSAPLCVASMTYQS